MKALELADRLSERADYLEKHAEGDTLAREAAAELRRLAEVNAELLGALEAIVESANRSQAAINIPLVVRAKGAIAKSKEQQ